MVPGNSKLVIPRSLARRVQFWKEVWSEHVNRVYLLIDGRRPWVIHTRVDCRDLFKSEEATAREEARCDQRIRVAKKKLVRKLRRQRRRPRKVLVKAFGNSRGLARSAYRNVTVLEGRKENLERGLRRAEPYLGQVERVFEKNGLPPVLAHLAFIESLFQPEAQSPAGAVGAYQFVESTAREYLMIADGIDERLDPVRESWAAASYLKELHQTFRSWPLALTAYNCGPTRLKRVIKRRRTRDIGKLVDRGNYGNFGFDGQNYYAQIAAVVQLTNGVERKPPGKAMVVEVPRAMPLEKIAGCLNTTSELLLASNPAFTREIHRGEAPVPQGYLLAVPADDKP
jgi:membrane-bound lytic murein transglycosylase D